MSCTLSDAARKSGVLCRSMECEPCKTARANSNNPQVKRYRKKPVVVDAAQWFGNGDHPQDNSQPMTHSETGEEILSEGKVVRYFRHPGKPGDHHCDKCNQTYHNHGWVDTLEGGHNVCPGDWIITGVEGEYYPCKPSIFEKTYEEVNHD